MHLRTTLVHVIGARPNFMKVAPLLRVLDQDPGFENVLVHTGQHYDAPLSDMVLHDLGVRAPDYNLGVGSGSHAGQTAAVMLGIESVLEEVEPALVVVVGDVNSTLAAALTACKLGITVAHVEAGLRSRDRDMPEEINRILTDQLSEILLTPSRGAGRNLLAEGIHRSRIHFVGNIMIDALQGSLQKARRIRAWEAHGLEEYGYGVVTLHRPSNVDNPDQLAEIFGALDEIAETTPLLFPMHPRTRERAEGFGVELHNVKVIEPVAYLEMISLQSGAAIVLTDSGGVQEETTILNVPCLTLRSSTERPITIEQGTNRLVPIRSRQAIRDAYEQAMEEGASGTVPELWDGRTSARIAHVLREWRDEGPGLAMRKSAGMLVEGGESPHA